MSRLLLFLLSVPTLPLLLHGCGPLHGSGGDNYGLRRVDIILSQDNKAQLAHSGKDQLPVSGRVQIEKSVYRGWLSLSGEGSIDYIKRSYRFRSTDDNGLEPPAVPFKSMRFGAQAQDHSMLRTLLGYRIYAALGLPTPAVEPIVLYLNDAFQGLYLLIEAVDSDFYERRGIGTARIYKAKTNRAKFDSRMIGDPEFGVETELGGFDLPEIERLVTWAHLPQSQATLEQIQAGVDLETVARQFAANLFLANVDGFDNNWYLFTERDRPLLKFSPWDWERVYDLENSPENVKSLLAINRFVAHVVGYPGVRQRFAQILQELSDGFPQETVRAALDSDAAKIQRAYSADRYLGGLGYDLNQQKQDLFDNYLSWSASVRSEFDQLPLAQPLLEQ